MKKHSIVVVVGLAALVTGWFVLNRPATRTHPSPTPSNGVHTNSSPEPGQPNGPISSEHAVSTPPNGSSRAAPTRPGFENLDDESMNRFVEYLQELWNYTARESVEEIDAIIKKDGPSAALQRVREVALAKQHAGPRFEKRLTSVPFPDLKMPPSVLKEADFHSWFHALLLARLIPHIVGQSPESGVLRDSLELLGSILAQEADPSLSLYAAVCLSPTRSSGTPDFLRSWEYRDGTRVPCGITFDPLDGNKPPPSPEGGGWQYALRKSMLPSIKDDSAAAAAMMSAFRGTRELAIKYMILEGMAVSKHSQDYLNVYFDVMRDHELLARLGSALLPLIEQNAHLPEVRRTIDAEIAPSSQNPDLRSTLVRQLPSFYPSERAYADLASSLVRSENEDPQVRTAAAFALTQYYGGRMRSPEYRDVITSFLRDRTSNAQHGTIELVTKSIEEHQLTEFIPVLEEIIRQWRLNPPADDPDGDKAAVLESLENALATLREAGK